MRNCIMDVCLVLMFNNRVIHWEFISVIYKQTRQHYSISMLMDRRTILIIWISHVSPNVEHIADSTHVIMHDYRKFILLVIIQCVCRYGSILTPAREVIKANTSSSSRLFHLWLISKMKIIRIDQF